jgi:hypothetical protein
VSFERISLVPVFGESFAAQLLAVFVGGYKFCNPWESLCERRHLIAEVDKQVTGCNIVVATTYRDRGLLRTSGRENCVVRYKTAIAKCPKQLIEAFRTSSVTGMDVNRVLEPIGFLRQPACERLTRRQAGLFENVKVDPGH